MNNNLSDVTATLETTAGAASYVSLAKLGAACGADVARVPPRARAAARLHGGARGGGSGGDARGVRAARGRARAHQPGDPRRPRDRSLGAGGSLRHGPRVRRQRRPRDGAQPRALRVPALGGARVLALPRGAAGHGHLPPGEPRVPGERGVRRRRGPGVPGHAGRHRLAHHDDQRPRRARLGRRRHRGRGRHARAARHHALPEVVGVRLTAACPTASPPPTSC
jgi:hypothetical protein